MVARLPRVVRRVGVRLGAGLVGEAALADGDLAALRKHVHHLGLVRDGREEAVVGDLARPRAEDLPVDAVLEVDVDGLVLLEGGPRLARRLVVLLVLTLGTLGGGVGDTVGVGALARPLAKGAHLLSDHLDEEGERQAVGGRRLVRRHRLLQLPEEEVQAGPRYARQVQKGGAARPLEDDSAVGEAGLDHGGHRLDAHSLAEGQLTRRVLLSRHSVASSSLGARRARFGLASKSFRGAPPRAPHRAAINGPRSGRVGGTPTGSIPPEFAKLPSHSQPFECRLSAFVSNAVGHARTALGRAPVARGNSSGAGSDGSGPVRVHFGRPRLSGVPRCGAAGRCSCCLLQARGASGGADSIGFRADSEFSALHAYRGRAHRVRVADRRGDARSIRARRCGYYDATRSGGCDTICQRLRRPRP